MAAVEVPQTLEYKGGQLNAALVLEVENFTNWKKRKPETQWTHEERKAANLDQRLKSLILSMLPDDQMNFVINCLTVKYTWDDLILYHEGPSDVKESRIMDLKLCYNTFKFKEGFINGLPKKWLAFCQSLRNTNHVKESELASLFGKLKYEENLINSIYDTNQEKTLVPTTPLSTAFFFFSIVQDFQDNPDDEEDSRSSQERSISDDNEIPEVKALMALADEERVFVGKESARNGEWIKISMKKKKILGIDQLTEDTSSSGPQDPMFVKSSADNSEVSITGSNKPKLYGVKVFTLSNHDTGKVLFNESQKNTTDHSVVVSDSSVTDYDSANDSLVCSTLLPPLEKLTSAKPVSGPKTIKSILKSKSTFKAETLKGIIINKPSSAPVKGNKSFSASKTNSAPAGKLKNVKIEDDPPLAIVMKELNELKLQFSKNKSSLLQNKHS
ncbi:hypothetical protein Tco_1284502 [Tanacetum coccineum]